MMVLFERHSRLLLAFLQASFVLVSSRPSYEASFSIYRTPSEQKSNLVDFLINGNHIANIRTHSADDNVSAYIINQNGEYIPIPIQSYGSSDGNEGTVWTNSEINQIPNGDGNYDNIPIVYFDSYGAVTENPVAIEKNNDYEATNGAANPGAIPNKGILSLLNPIETIGQQEQKLRDYYAELLSNQFAQTESSTTAHTSSTPTSVTVDQRKNQLNQSSIVLSNQPFNKQTISSSTATKAPEIYTTLSVHRSTSEIPMEMLIHHDITKEGNKPAAMDKQPNTLLFTDPFEESEEDKVSYLFDFDRRKIHPENTHENEDFKIDERSLVPHSNPQKSGKAGKSHGSVSKPNSTNVKSAIADNLKLGKRFTDSQVTNISKHHGRHRKPHSTKPATAFDFVFDDARLAPHLKRKLNMTTDIVEKENQTVAISSIRVNHDFPNSTNNESKIINIPEIFDEKNFKFTYATTASNVTPADSRLNKINSNGTVNNRKETKFVVDSVPGNVTSSYQNVFSTFVDALYTSAAKSVDVKLTTKESHPPMSSDVWKSVNQLMYGATNNQKKTGKIPGRGKDRVALWKAPSRNVAAQNEIISSIITKIVESIINPIYTRTSHRMFMKKHAQHHQPNFLKIQLQEVKFPE